MTVNAQYNLARPGSLPVKIAGYQRRKMFAAFVSLTGVSPTDTVLDVGATSDRLYDHSNYLEAWWPDKTLITAVGTDDAAILQSLYPGLCFVRANGCDLPFPDNSFDFAHSSAVLEHVGDRKRQERFLYEMARVARRGIFVTTPNRWFPVEFHTLLPFIHWLPPRWYRNTLIRIGKPFFAAEENLNLLSRRDLTSVACNAGLKRLQVTTVSLLGLPTNLILLAQKGETGSTAAQDHATTAIDV
jgi:SAM-dependent methyltransferase